MINGMLFGFLYNWKAWDLKSSWVSVCSFCNFTGRLSQTIQSGLLEEKFIAVVNKYLWSNVSFQPARQIVLCLILKIIAVTHLQKGGNMWEYAVRCAMWCYPYEA